MAPVFAVVNGAARCFSSPGTVLTDPRAYDLMKVDGLSIRSIGFSRASMTFSKLLCSGHGKMQYALALLVVVMTNYMLALPAFVDLGGESANLSEPIVMRAPCAGEAPTSEL